MFPEHNFGVQSAIKSMDNGETNHRWKLFSVNSLCGSFIIFFFKTRLIEGKVSNSDSDLISACHVAKLKCPG